jgi:hypothetical protein
MRSCEVQVIAQEMDQKRAIFGFDRDRPAVYRQLDRRHIIPPDDF